MNRKHLFTACVLTPLAAAPALAQQQDHLTKEMGGGKFGTVHFPTSCSPAAQAQFENAVAMLHSFFYPTTLKAFAAVTQTDPQCAIAYWGLAIAQRPNPLVPPFDEAALKRGWDAVERGLKVTMREEDQNRYLNRLFHPLQHEHLFPDFPRFLREAADFVERRSKGAPATPHPTASGPGTPTQGGVRGPRTGAKAKA